MKRGWSLMVDSLDLRRFRLILGFLGAFVFGAWGLVAYVLSFVEGMNNAFLVVVDASLFEWVVAVGYAVVLTSYVWLPCVLLMLFMIINIRLVYETGCLRKGWRDFLSAQGGGKV